MIKLQENSINAENHFLAVKDVIQKRIRKIINPRATAAISALYRGSALTGFLPSLLIDANLRHLITLPPYLLKLTIKKYKRDLPSMFNPASDEYGIISNIFLDHAYEKLEKFEFIKKAGLDVCPYCNRNYIYALDKKNKIKPQIDHFYPQSKYPFLGVSYYNLIPSCLTCNGLDAKKDQDPLEKGLVNPYLIAPHSFKFTYSIRSINILNPLADKNAIKVRFKDKINAHLDVFKLHKFYEQHSDHVLELVIKSKVIYADAYRHYLSTYRGLRFSSDDIDRLILGNYTKPDEVHKRPLAKLYQDIAKELGLI